MMMAYNCHVHGATHEMPFFLTYLHSPRLPYFDLEKPCLLYGEDWSSLAFTKMQNAFKQVRSNLESAREVRENYFNKKTKECVFKVGDCVLVKFPNHPRGVNPKIYKKWKGYKDCGKSQFNVAINNCFEANFGACGQSPTPDTQRK